MRAVSLMLCTALVLTVSGGQEARASGLDTKLEQADQLTQQKRWLEAAESYEALLIDPALQKRPKLRQQIQGKLAIVIFELGMLKIDGPKGARISLDGKPVGELPLEPIRTTPGKHKLRVEKSGFIPLAQEVVVEAGITTPINAKLVLPTISESARSSSAAPSLAVTAPKPKPSSSGSRWWLWTALGLVVASGIAAGIAVGATRQDPFVPMTELGVSRFEEWSEP